MNKSLHVLIKPASSLCNLACTYCFYHDVAKYQETHSRKIMSIEIMKRIIDDTLVMALGKSITFGFQGGEPLIAPLSFYEAFVEYVNEKNIYNTLIQYTIQTNGILLTETHAKFFKNNNFLVGLSLDGGEKINNLFRLTENGIHTYAKVIDALNILKKYEIAFNILVVVTHQSTPYIKDIYNDLKQLGVMFLQFIPVLEPFNSIPFSMSYALTQEDYANYHIDLWDMYKHDRKQGEMVFIRYFDNLKSMINHQRVEQCGVSGMCHAQIVVESDGTVYPCDFYSDSQHKLGNLLENTMSEIVKTKTMSDFIVQSLKVNQECIECKFYTLCRGGCKRYHHEDSSHTSKHKYCEGIKLFLNHVLET